MRVGIIGGTEKNLTRYEELASSLACEVEFHDGRMAGRGSEALETLVSRCDLVVIITQINSHAAVRTAQKYCRKLGRRALLVRRFGLHSFASAVQVSAASSACVALQRGDGAHGLASASTPSARMRSGSARLATLPLGC